MRRAIIPVTACALAIAFGAVLAPTAGGSPSKSLPIQHGVGIGAIKLGMSGTDVQRRLGRPRAVIERRVVRGQPYVEFEYDFGAWNIGFLGRKGQRRVVLVGTGLRLHKSPEGVGVGTTELVFWRRVRGQGFSRRICDRPDPSGSLNNLVHWVRRGRDSETVYFPGGAGSLQEVRGAPTVGCAF
jgi:hypothetical protein